MKYPSVAILILHNNGEKILKNCLNSLKKTDYPNFKTFVLLYQSTDKSEEIIKKHKITYFKSDKNLGFAGGNNFLINKTKSDYIVFLNNDTEVDKNWLKELIDFSEKNKIAACQPKVLNLVNKSAFDYAGASGGFIDKYGYPFCRGRIFNNLENDHGQYNAPKQIFWASGACMLVKRKVLDKVGYFDESLFLYGEELDLCWRINNSGENLFVVPSAKIYHLGSYSVNAAKMNRKKQFLIQRNTFIVLIKNHFPSSMSRILKRLSLELISTFESFSRALAVLKSLLWILFNLRKVITMRRNAQKTRRISENDLQHIIYPKSIAISYYLKGKSKFSQLTEF